MAAPVNKDEPISLAEHTRAILQATLKGYQAGENVDAKHWRERAETAEAKVDKLTKDNEQLKAQAHKTVALP